MDINFHYFAIKATAIKAGFSEDDAQTIASYSQYVDDYTSYAYMYFTNVPSFAQHLAKKIPTGWFFNPVTTGFETWFDMALLMLEKNQRRIVIPFHFIPPKNKLNHLINNRTEWRVEPARMDTNSLIRTLLKDGKQKYLDDQSKLNLMRIGMLLHIFADTYAHQNFSGFWDWENHSKLTAATRNDKNNENVLDTYSPNDFFKLPSIGHTNVNHAPDDSNISFEMEEKLNERDDYSIKYQRSNTREFLVAIKEILNFLLSCREADPIEELEWDELSQIFAKGLLTPLKDITLLGSYWKDKFRDTDFHYDKEKLSNLLSEPITENNLNEIHKFMENFEHIDSVAYTATSDEFFYYNVFADEIRNFVNGESVKDEEWDCFIAKIDSINN